MKPQKKITRQINVALATVNLCLWVWLAGSLYRDEAGVQPAPLGPGLGFLVAGWILYRAVSELRRLDPNRGSRRL